MTAKLSWQQLSTLRHAERYTDGDTPMQRSGEVTTRGMVARGSTIRSLERRGLVVFGGWCCEIDGDGFAVTGNDDAPYYTITDTGRAALAEAAEREIAKMSVNTQTDPTVPPA